MIVNHEDAKKTMDTGAVTITELRELFYVKIPDPFQIVIDSSTYNS